MANVVSPVASLPDSQVLHGNAVPGRADDSVRADVSKGGVAGNVQPSSVPYALHGGSQSASMSQSLESHTLGGVGSHALKGVSQSTHMSHAVESHALGGGDSHTPLVNDAHASIKIGPQSSSVANIPQSSDSHPSHVVGIGVENGSVGKGGVNAKETVKTFSSVVGGDQTRS